MAITTFKVTHSHRITTVHIVLDAATDTTPAFPLAPDGAIKGTILSRVLPTGGTYGFNIQASGDGTNWVTIRTQAQNSLATITNGNLAGANYMRIAMTSLSAGTLQIVGRFGG